MKSKLRIQKRLNKTFIAALTLMLGAIGVLLWPSASHAQQEPNRQLVQSGSANVNGAKRIALVIGNGAYTKAPPLKNPPNDARDMAANLRTLGFEVSSGVNVRQREMKRLIREFGQKLKAGGNGLFYYAGHGVQARGHNYIIPVNADIQSEADVEDSGVDVGLVLNYMDDAQNGLNIVILDACRNNPFSRSFRSASEGLAQVDAPTGTLIAYATAPGRVAADGAGDNGLYTSELLKAMRLPGLTATDMFMQVRGEVMKRTGNKQVPWEASSLVGSFYFSGSPTSLSLSNTGANSPAPVEARFDAAAFEYSYWETIKNSNSADDFKAYLTKYPEGQFAALAKNRIKNLEVATKPAEAEPSSRNSGAAEIAFWDSVKNSSNVEDFRAYLKKYPNGEFAELAKNRLKPLEILREKEDRFRSSAPKPFVDLQPGTYNYKAKWKAAGMSGQSTQKTEIKDGGASWIVNESYRSSAGEGYTTSTIEKGTLQPTHLSTRGPMEIELDLKDNKAIGTVTPNGELRSVVKARSISVVLDGPLFAYGAGAFHVIAALPLAEGYNVSFRTLNLQNESVLLNHLKVLGSETITVPAGSFEAYKVEVTSTDGQTVVWIAKDSRKVLKTVIAFTSGFSTTMELVP